MPLVERRSSLQRTKFPTFGIVYLIFLALKNFSEAGIRATKPHLMTRELDFSEDFSIIVLHTQMAGSYLVMFVSNILADMYFGPYCAYITQEVVRLFVTYPLCMVGVVGYLPLMVRRTVYLSGQGVAIFSALGMGGLNVLVAEQFSERNYNKFLALRLYISLLFTFLGVVILPQLVVAFGCFKSDDCYFIVWMMDWVVGLIILLMFICGRNILYRPRPGRSAFIVSMRLAQLRREERRRNMAAEIRSRTTTVNEESRVFDESLRRDTQKVWSMWKFFIPLSCYWGLQSQYTTTWIFQAINLDGSLTSNKDSSIVILSNQVWGVVPLFGLIFVPLLALWMRNTRTPLRVITASQLVMVVAFFFASYLECYISLFLDNSQFTDISLHRYHAVPQHVLVAFSEISFTLGYRMFTFRTIPKSMQQVTRNLSILSKCFGNALVSLVVLFHYFLNFPDRQVQFFFYSVLLSGLIVVFTLLNNNFDNLLQSN